MHYKISPIDTTRLHIKTAKAYLSEGDLIDDLLQRAKRDSVELIIFRIPAHCLGLVQEAESAGAFLTDTLVYFQKNNIEPFLDALPEGYHARIATPNDKEAVEKLAAATFAEYPGHYRMDPYLPQEVTEGVYSDWASHACVNTQVADAVIVIEKEKEMAAFAVLKRYDPNSFEGLLIGVAPSHRNRHIYLRLMQIVQDWGIQQKYQKMVISTQITNTTVQKVWSRLGFELQESFYTMHKWIR